MTGTVKIKRAPVVSRCPDEAKRNIDAARKSARELTSGKSVGPGHLITPHGTFARSRSTMCRNMFPLVAELADPVQFSIFHIGVLWRERARTRVNSLL